MDRRWLPLNALRAFEAAGHAGSFTGAAQVLLVTQSAVSRHVIALEDMLGTPLFERRRQSLELTDAGRRLLPVVTKALDRISATLDEIVEQPEGRRLTLPVALPPTFAVQLAVPMLADFRAAFPEIALEIHTLGTGAARERQRVACAVIYSEPRVSEDVLDLLWQVRVTPMCHPELAARAADQPIARFLGGQELIHVANEGKPYSARWEAFATFAGCPELECRRGMVFDTAQMAVQYALSGLGVALLDERLFAAELESGRLARPYDIGFNDSYAYYLAVNAEELSNPVVAAFRGWILRRFGALGARGEPA